MERRRGLVVEQPKAKVPGLLESLFGAAGTLISSVDIYQWRRRASWKTCAHRVITETQNKQTGEWVKTAGDPCGGKLKKSGKWWTCVACGRGAYLVGKEPGAAA